MLEAVYLLGPKPVSRYAETQGFTCRIDLGLISCKRGRSNNERYALCMLYGMCMECYGKSEVGTGDRPFLFDLFSLLSGYFCFVGFSLSSLLFFS